MSQQITDITQAQTGIEFLNVIFSQGINALKRLYADKELHARCKKALDGIPKFDASLDGNGYVGYIGMEPSQWDNEPGVTYLVLYIYDASQKKGDWWRGSTSQAYMTGNNSDRTYVQNTIRQLEKVGATVQDGKWGSLVKQLLNKQIPFWVSENESKSGRKFYRIASLGESRKLPEALAMPGFDVDDAFGSAPQTAPKANPFA